MMIHGPITKGGANFSVDDHGGKDPTADDDEQEFLSLLIGFCMEWE